MASNQNNQQQGSQKHQRGGQAEPAEPRTKVASGAVSKAARAVISRTAKLLKSKGKLRRFGGAFLR